MAEIISNHHTMSHQTPYSPIHPPEKPVTQERMQQILANRTSLQTALNAPPRPPSALEKLKLPSTGETLENKPIDATSTVKTPVSRPPLEWDKPVLTGIEAGTKSGYRRSTDGHYSVTRDISGDSISYSAWRLLPDLQRHGKPWKQMAEPLGCYPTGEEAKAVCGADAGQLNRNG